jgi:hypothetical protein
MRNTTTRCVLLMAELFTSLRNKYNHFNSLHPPMLHVLHSLLHFTRSCISVVCHQSAHSLHVFLPCHLGFSFSPPPCLPINRSLGGNRSGGILMSCIFHPASSLLSSPARTKRLLRRLHYSLHGGSRATAYLFICHAISRLTIFARHTPLLNPIQPLLHHHNGEILPHFRTVCLVTSLNDNSCVQIFNPPPIQC